MTESSVKETATPLAGQGTVTNFQPDTNAVLKSKYRRLHGRLVKLDLSEIIDELFGNYVVTLSSKQELHSIKSVAERSERLLQLLHASEHPKAFIKLHAAIQQQQHDDFVRLAKDVDDLQVDMEDLSLYALLKGSGPLTVAVTRDDDNTQPSVTAETVENARLKLKFKKLHHTVVRSLNVYSVIGWLFQEAVIGEADMRSLQRLRDDPQQQCIDLLALLHTSAHPHVFIQLFTAVKAEPHLQWLVDEIHRLDITDHSLTSLMDKLQQLYIDDTTFGSTVNTLPAGQPVFGVTVLAHRIYVLRDNTRRGKEVEVYDTASCSFQRHLPVPELSAFLDVVACERNRCLYICDNITRAVHRVTEDGREAAQWPVNDEPCSLSVSPTGNILVTCRQVRRIKEFSARGDLVRQVALTDDVVNPWHSVALGCGQLIVCHGARRDPVHRVLLISPDGRRTLHSYGSEGELSGPCRLAVDNNGLVFVADVYTRQVVLLSPTLTYLRQVVVSRDDGLRWCPRRLWLDVDMRRLYVADNEWKDGKPSAGRILVVAV